MPKKPIEEIVGDIKLIQMSIKVICEDIKAIKKELAKKKEPVSTGWFY
jgi:hypothetical protein|tara:strand:- start:926 stop:1069 length:144 start_codon:yes stop_codon:yes gene_type:complete